MSMEYRGHRSFGGRARIRTLIVGGVLALAAPAGCGVPGLDIDRASAGTFEKAKAAPPSAPAVTVAPGDQVPLGQTVKLGDWEIVVRETDLDATKKVLEENRYNEPPEPGRQFVSSEFTLTNVGTKEASLIYLSFSIVGRSDSVFESFDANSRCGVIPNDIDRMNDVDPGESRTGNVCVSVPAEEIEGAEWKVQDLADLASESIVLLSLR